MTHEKITGLEAILKDERTSIEQKDDAQKNWKELKKEQFTILQ